MSKTVMFNPYTGTPRHPSDIASDPEGILIHEDGAPLRSATASAQLLEAREYNERRAFEQAAYARYQTMKVAGLLAKGDGDGSPEALFWKQPNGEYGVLMFNAAWWGWRAAKGLV
jgi:hypothetical protein